MRATAAMDQLTQQLLRYYALRRQITDHEAGAALDHMITRLQATLAGEEPAAARLRPTEEIS